jgi:hypothetical protein
MAPTPPVSQPAALPQRHPANPSRAPTIPPRPPNPRAAPITTSRNPKRYYTRTRPSKDIRNSIELYEVAEQYSDAPIYETLSLNTLSVFNSPNYLSVLHLRPEGHPDQLLRLHLLLKALQPLDQYDLDQQINISAGVVVVVDNLDKKCNGFKQVQWVVNKYKEPGHPELNGDVWVFGNLVVVRGLTRHWADDDARRVLMCTRQAISNVMNACFTRGFIWHECTNWKLLELILAAISNETNEKRTKLKAISIASGLSIASNMTTIKEDLAAPNIWETVLRYSKILDIPILFVDSFTLGLGDPHNGLTTSGDSSHGPSQQWGPRASYLLGLSSEFTKLLPQAVWEAIVHRGMDDLAVGVYRLWVEGFNMPQSEVVNQVRTDLRQAQARYWAKHVYSESEYTNNNRKPPRNDVLRRIARLAEAPIDFPLDTFLSHIVDPTRDTSAFKALRADITRWPTPKVQVNSNSDCPTYLLISRNRTNVRKSLNDTWTKFIAPYTRPENRYETLPTGIALSWQHLTQHLKRYITMLWNTQEHRGRWTLEQTEICYNEIMVNGLWNGSMTQICELSLGNGQAEN